MRHLRASAVVREFSFALPIANRIPLQGHLTWRNDGASAEIKPPEVATDCSSNTAERFEAKGNSNFTSLWRVNYHDLHPDRRSALIERSA